MWSGAALGTAPNGLDIPLTLSVGDGTTNGSGRYWWLRHTDNNTLEADSDELRITLDATRTGGTQNNAYFDDISVEVTA